MTKDRKGRRVEQCPGGEKLMSHETLTGYKRPQDLFSVIDKMEGPLCILDPQELC